VEERLNIKLDWLLLKKKQKELYEEDPLLMGIEHIQSLPKTIKVLPDAKPELSKTPFRSLIDGQQDELSE